MQAQNRASMIELDDAMPPKADPMPSPVVVAPGTVGEAAKARIIGQSEALKAAGFTMPKGDAKGVTSVGFEYGRRVVELGDENLKASNQEFGNLPTTEEGLSKLYERVKAEGRTNVRGIPLARIRLADDGMTLAYPDGSRWAIASLTRTGWRHLAESLAPSTGLVRYLPDAPAAVKRIVVASHAEMAGDRTVAFGVKGNVNAAKLTPITNANGEVFQPGTVFRVSTDTYTPYEPHTAISDLLSMPEFGALFAGSRVDIRYDGEKARIRVMWHADTIPDAASGDTFKVGIEFSLDDVKSGSVRVSLLAFRNECQNFIIIAEMKVSVARSRHSGNVARIAEKVVEGARNAQSRILKAFIEPWNAARKEALFNAFNGDPVAVFQGLVGSGLVDIPGKKADVVDRLVSAWQAEPGYTRADLLNAVTRAAHTGGWWENIGEQSAVEESAGKLLYVQNLSGKLESGYAEFHGVAPV